jgi:hypothetical protein
MLSIVKIFPWYRTNIAEKPRFNFREMAEHASFVDLLNKSRPEGPFFSANYLVRSVERVELTLTSPFR